MKRLQTRSHRQETNRNGLPVLLDDHHPVSRSTHSKTCVWCGHASHATRCDCPASNDTCHGCGKRRHWQQVCRASATKVVFDVDQNPHSDPQSAYSTTNDACQVSSAPKGIFVDLDISPPAYTPASAKRLRFQVDSGCSCNTIHVTDLNKLAPLPPGELSLDYIKLANPELFEGLGKMSEPFSITLNPDVKPIQAPPHRYAAPKLPIIKEALDKLFQTGQLVRVNEPTPWISNMVVRERPASATKPAKVPICLDPSQTVNKAIIRPVYPIPTPDRFIDSIKQRSSQSLILEMHSKPLS